MEITRKDVSRPVGPIYEYTIVLSEAEARELREVLGKTSGCFRVFKELATLINNQ